MQLIIQDTIVVLFNLIFPILLMLLKSFFHLYSFQLSDYIEYVELATGDLDSIEHVN